MKNNKSILSSIPASHRAYFVKKQTRVPSGDRNDPQILKEPWYWVMRRPVNPKGERCEFYGTKNVTFKGPFVGDAGKDIAEKMALMRNEMFHSTSF